jgi:hypothetical protein
MAVCKKTNGAYNTDRGDNWIAENERTPIPLTITPIWIGK